MDTTTPLSQPEAGRVKTEIERIHSKNVKYRMLIGYTPKEVAERLTTIKVKAEDIARYAGRDE
jgi:hypothetical protein